MNRQDRLDRFDYKLLQSICDKSVAAEISLCPHADPRGTLTITNVVLWE